MARTKFFIHGFAGNLADEIGPKWGGGCMVAVFRVWSTAPFFDEAKPNKLKPEDGRICLLHALEGTGPCGGPRKSI